MGGYVFFWERVWQAHEKLLAGTMVTIEVAVAAIALASLVGIAGGVARRSGNRVVARVALAYVELMRNSPSLVKMYFIYFGLPTVGLYPSSVLSGVLALVLHNGAYMTEIFRGGLEAVPEAQIQAATSLGMRPVLVFRLVILPQAFRRSLPALGNNWVEMIKDTSITSAIAVPELFSVVTSLISETMRSFELLAAAAAVYFVLTTMLTGGLRLLESRVKYPI